MPAELTDLKVREVSMVDRPANASFRGGKKIPHAVVALFKRDEEAFEAVLKAAKGIKFVIGFPKGGGGSKVQSVIFDQEQWTEAKAKKWLADNDFVSGKVDKTENSLRFRQEDPEKFESFRTIEPGQTSDKGETTMPMTLAQIEEKVVKQDETITAQGAEITTLKAERLALVAENEAVLKMSKPERQAYALMDVGKRKEYLAADEKKKKEMVDVVCAAKREADLIASMDDTLKAQFASAGPVEKAALLEVAEKKLVAKTAKTAKTHGEPDGDEEEEEMEMKDEEKAATAAAKREAEALELAKREKAVVEDRLAKAEAELTRIKKRERLVEFAKRAEAELPHTAGSPEDKGDMLMKMADTFGEESETYKRFFQQLKAADSAMSAHFREVGKSGGVINGEQALQAKAQEIAKRDRITIEKAYTKVSTECPQLWYEYETERRQHAARQ